ncbi:lactate dehydrogenase [Pseudidiomarina salinarum]|uniref:Lactate dehydrogenase n=1 Tax=Pseudidiomarina salinarum TaxID=435908 RepID=A0A094IR73_9GAMM|nr:Ldh family oxidoreductase [Pseudidiomarina salinarum]KFZ30185.1 lactate dehydrogenase [Pseudidiomarina salinarum]RUO68686.1 lactate dehydrogenase [Pseudidiomarina salinarum]
MSESKIYRVDAAAINRWAQACAMQAGASAQIAADIARYLVAGDLLGFRTHGLLRLRYNLNCLESGQSKPAGEPRVLKQRAATQLWDADLLPGLHTMPKAIAAAIDMARECGTGTVIMRRTQHVAALAVYLEQATDAGMLVQLMAATPAQQAVAPFGAKSAWFSPNPLAIGVPTTSSPVLFDISLSMTAAGKVRTAIAEQRDLPYAALITAAGDYTCDPTTFLAEPPSVLAPLGGEQLGYKGTGLNLFSEFWTLALSQYGRHQAAGDGDANTVWVQVIDPDAFGDALEFRRQSQAIVDGMLATTSIDAAKPVRVPGSGALAARERQLNGGVEYTPAVWKQLQWCAEHCQQPLPEPI